MRIIFFGTPPFSVAILKGLVEADKEVVAIVTQPDKPAGRSGALVPSAVKSWAQEHLPNIPIFQPVKASAENVVAELAALQPDFLVVAAFGQILKQNLLDIPKQAAINVHTSLLPKYRGAAPIQRAIMAGEKETGITIMHMVLRMDAGGILKQVACPVSDDMTAGDLEAELLKLAVPALNEVLDIYSKGAVQERLQDESLVVMAPKIELEETQVHWHHSAQALHNLVRGVTPEPGAWFMANVRGQPLRIRIRKTRPVVFAEPVAAGSVLPSSDKGLLIACGSDALLIGELQPEGRKWMSSQAFLNGLQKGALLTLGEIL